MDLSQTKLPAEQLPQHFIAAEKQCFHTVCLVFVGVADLSVLDPVVTGARPTRNAAYLVFDTLYGIGTEWKAQPQMVEAHAVEEDGLTWTLKLRDGLRFHDNEPVLARDVVASIRRFAPRVIFTNALMDATDECPSSEFLGQRAG
jgi:peptide/nickel transport system substrate-binding protein